MNRFVRDAKIASTIVSVLIIILGLFLVLYPGSAVKTICWFVGIILLIAGALILLSCLFGLGGPGFMGMQMDVFRLIIGVILLAIGLFVTARPEAVADFISILFGVILFIHAANGLHEMMELKSLNDEKWYLSLIYSIAVFVMGAIVLINPFGTMKFAMTLTGVFLVVSGACSLLTGVRVIHFDRKFRKDHPGEQSRPGRRKDVIDLPPEDVQEEDMGPGRPFE